MRNDQQSSRSFQGAALWLLYSLAGFPKTSSSRHVKSRVDEVHAGASVVGTSVSLIKDGLDSEVLNLLWVAPGRSIVGGSIQLRHNFTVLNFDLEGVVLRSSLQGDEDALWGEREGST